MRQVFGKALSVMGQRKSRRSAEKSRIDDKRQDTKAPANDFGMSPEDALRVGTMAGYK